MKLKNFRDLIKKRFTKDEIAAIEQQAKLEIKVLQPLQTSAKQAIDLLKKSWK